MLRLPTHPDENRPEASRCPVCRRFDGEHTDGCADRPLDDVEIETLAASHGHEDAGCDVFQISQPVDLPQETTEARHFRAYPTHYMKRVERLFSATPRGGRGA